MFEHAIERFASKAASIRAGAQDSAEFCDILNDYEEICTHLAAQVGNRNADAAELSIAREVASALEKEIEEFLAKH